MPTSGSLATSEAEGTTSFAVRVVPGASRDEVVGVEDGALKVRLRARAVEGQANEALLQYLADRLDVRRRQVTLLRGQTARRKLVAAEGVTAAQVGALVPETP